MANNICSSISTAIVGSCSYIKCRIAECFDKPARKPELHITSGMRRPGPRSVSLQKLKDLMDSEELDLSHILGELQGFSNSPVTLTQDVIYISGYLDPQLKLIGTDLRKNLEPYIKNPLAIRCMSFAGAAFRRMTIERCALQVIKKLNDIYRDSINEEINLNLIGHSMGARIAEVVTQILYQYPELGEKKFIFNKIISLNGANKGSPVAVLAGGLICCSDNIAKDLRADQISYEDQSFIDLDIEASYLAVSNDKIIPPDYAAPPSMPVIVLHDISRFSPHTAILDDPFAKLWLIKQLSGEQYEQR